MAVVGEAFLSAFLEVLVDRMASGEVLDYFRRRKLNDGYLKKLKTTLLSIKPVINDAKDKRSMKPDVKNWLDELKDAIYDAEDLLGEIAYEALMHKKYLLGCTSWRLEDALQQILWWWNWYLQHLVSRWIHQCT